MNTISFNLGFILFFALIVWVFLANDLYLKIFFLKRSKKNRRNEISDNMIFEQAYGGETIPEYIKDAILKSQDKYELLSLYLGSKKLINIKVYKSLLVDSNDLTEKMYVNFVKSSFNSFYNIFYWLRWVSIFLLYSFFCYMLSGFVSGMLSDFKFKLILLIFCLISLMPYGFFTENNFYNKICGLSVFVSSILLSWVSVDFIYFILPDSKFYLVFIIDVIMILLGAYFYIGYSKFEYMKKFFDLVKFNLAQNSNDENTALDSIVTDPNQTISS